MNLNKIIYAIEVSKTGSISKAAKKPLHIPACHFHGYK